MIWKRIRWFMLIAIFALVASIFISPEYTSPGPEIVFVQVKDAQVTREQIAGNILFQSMKSGVDTCAAVEIALCESGIYAQAKNPSSSAKGIYQFIDGTWGAYCPGNVFDHEDNISCFMANYPKRSYWWECKRSL